MLMITHSRIRSRIGSSLEWVSPVPATRTWLQHPVPHTPPAAHLPSAPTASPTHPHYGLQLALLPAVDSISALGEREGSRSYPDPTTRQTASAMATAAIVRRGQYALPHGWCEQKHMGPGRGRGRASIGAPGSASRKIWEPGCVNRPWVAPVGGMGVG